MTNDSVCRKVGREKGYAGRAGRAPICRIARHICIRVRRFHLLIIKLSQHFINYLGGTARNSRARRAKLQLQPAYKPYNIQLTQLLNRTYNLYLLRYSVFTTKTYNKRLEKYIHYVHLSRAQPSPFSLQPAHRTNETQNVGWLLSVLISGSCYSTTLIHTNTKNTSISRYFSSFLRNGGLFV